MIYNKHQYFVFSADAKRTAANLEQAYTFWLNSRQSLLNLPISMYWAKRNSSEYLYIKQTTQNSGSSLGVRSDDTEQQLATYSAEKQHLQERVANADKLIAARAALYRRLHMPSLPDKQAEILRKLDVKGLLGTDLIVVGTNAFSAYEWAANAIFPIAYQETSNLDLVWCRGTPASLALSGSEVESQLRKTLIQVLKSIDSSYAISKKKSYIAVNSGGYKVELLVAPSCHPLPKDQGFVPKATLVEQEWLLLGRPINAVVATVRGRASPLTVPDPRFMAMHKLWLSDKPEHNLAKREKDRSFGDVLMDAVRHFMRSSHPINSNFVLSLPTDLRPTFDQWCAARQFIPQP